MSKAGVVLGLGALATFIVAISQQEVSAATGLADLYGFVTDDSGAAIENVTVNLSGTVTTTDVNGYYSLKSLQPGVYVLSFSKAGYQTITE